MDQDGGDARNGKVWKIVNLIEGHLVEFGVMLQPGQYPGAYRNGGGWIEVNFDCYDDCMRLCDMIEEAGDKIYPD